MPKIAALLLSSVIAAGAVAAASPAQAASCMQFQRIWYNQPGSDVPATNAKLNAEYVSLKNTCPTKTIVLTNWQLRDRDAHVYVFPSTRLAPGQTIVVHTGSGTQNSTNRYWGLDYYVWTNTGDRARLWNGPVLVDQCTWGNGPGYINC